MRLYWSIVKAMQVGVLTSCGTLLVMAIRYNTHMYISI